MNNWIYAPETDSAITEEGTGDIIMYVEDIHPEIVTEVKEMWNDSCSLAKVEKYLDKEIDGNRLTPDEKEFLMENLQSYYAMKGEGIVITTTVTGPEEQFPNNMDKEEVAKLVKEGVNPLVSDVVTPVRKAKKANTATTGKKKLSPEQMMKDLEAQIEAIKEKQQLVELLMNIQTPEFPENLSTAGRKMMLELSKEHSAMIAKYVEQIQEM